MSRPHDHSTITFGGKENTLDWWAQNQPNVLILWIVQRKPLRKQCLETLARYGVGMPEMELLVQDNPRWNISVGMLRAAVALAKGA